MKIALIIEGTYPWYMGGVSEWVYQYLLSFKDIDFYIIQITTDEYRKVKFDKAFYPIVPNVKKLIRIEVPPLDVINKNRFYEWWKNLSLHDQFLQDVQLIHVTNTGFAGLIGSYLSEYWNKPLILTEHAIYWKEIELGALALECGYTIPSEPRAMDIYKNYFSTTAKRVYKNAYKVISVSKYNIHYQYQLGAKNPIYIPNGVSQRLWSNSIKQKGKGVTVGWVGRCADLKNPLKFFDFVDAFLKFHKNVDFIMCLAQAGETELEKRVIQRASKYPELKLIWNQKAEKYYSEMDALCITSKHESQPLVLFEAIGHGVLPIGWEVGDAGTEFGVFVPYNETPEILARKFNEIIKNPEKYSSLLESLRKKVQSEHLWEKIFQQYRHIFKEVGLYNR